LIPWQCAANPFAAAAAGGGAAAAAAQTSFLCGTGQFLSLATRPSLCTRKAQATQVSVLHEPHHIAVCSSICEQSCCSSVWQPRRIHMATHHTSYTVHCVAEPQHAVQAHSHARKQQLLQPGHFAVPAKHRLRRSVMSGPRQQQTRIFRIVDIWSDTAIDTKHF
jgi:hypothetical protein